MSGMVQDNSVPSVLAGCVRRAGSGEAVRGALYVGQRSDSPRQPLQLRRRPLRLGHVENGDGRLHLNLLAHKGGRGD